MIEHIKSHLKPIAKKLAGYLMLLIAVPSFNACGNMDSSTFNEKIKRLNLKQKIKLSDIDRRYANHNFCIFSPYQSKVLSTFKDAKPINNQLNTIKFEVSESAILIFYDSNFQLRVEKLNGLYLRTLDVKTPTTEQIHVCGAVKDFHVYKFTKSTLAIFRR